MVHTMSDALRANFLGNSPGWYKMTIIVFLIVNPIIAEQETPGQGIYHRPTT